MKHRVSIKRIMMEIAGFFSLLVFFALFNYVVENQTDYRDLEPQWIDGDRYAFVRWYWKQWPGRPHMEIFASPSKDAAPEKIFTFSPDFHIYGIRFMRVSDDKKSLIMRLSREDIRSRFTLRDYLYIIPLSEGRNPKVWELDKNSKDDIFLACNNGTVIVRRTDFQGHNRLQFCEFGGAKEYCHFDYPPERICYSATLFDGGRKALVITSDGREGRNDNILHEINSDDGRVLFQMPVAESLMSPLYLPGRNRFVSTSISNNKWYYIYDQSTRKLTRVPNPAFTGALVSGLAVSGDEEHILVSCEHTLYRIGMDNQGVTEIHFPVRICPLLRQNPVDGRYLFSDGYSLYTADSGGMNLSGITRPSTKTCMERNSLYRWYAHTREHFFYLLSYHIIGETGHCSEQEVHGKDTF